jgi:oxygen-dependent protoporphyrinogen oxidase
MSLSSPASLKKIAVVGGGLTGLTAAWQLHRAGHRVVVFEKAPRVGGMMRSFAQDGWLVESGPNSLQETAPVAAILASLGLGAERVVADPAAAKRFIVRRDRLVPVPLSPPAPCSRPRCSRLARDCACSRRFSPVHAFAQPTPVSRILSRNISAVKSPTTA